MVSGPRRNRCDRQRSRTRRFDVTSLRGSSGKDVRDESPVLQQRGCPYHACVILALVALLGAQAQSVLPTTVFTKVPGCSITVGKDHWTIWFRPARMMKDPEIGPTYQRYQQVQVRKNRRVLLSFPDDADDDAGMLSAQRAWYPFPFPTFVIRAHSWAGHGEESNYYAIVKGGLVLMLKNSIGENGGPVFRDVDGDGKPEFIIDDYSYYEHWDKPQLHLLMYKLGRDSRLHLWKKVNRRGHWPLPEYPRSVWR